MSVYKGDKLVAGRVYEEKDIYSAEEVKTNKVWIDHKPIYRKVIISTFGLSPSSGKDIPLNDNIETPISCTFISNNGGSVGIRNDGGVYANFFPEAIKVRIGNWTLPSGTQKIIIEYTKTTD